MAARLQEVHPAVVHYPLTLLPVAIGADLVSRATGSETLRAVGKWGIALGAGAAALAALTGLAAQQEVKAEGEALDALITHRNLNLAAVAIATGMAVWRAEQDEPSGPYLALGLAALGVVSYTAYLGGHMVYELGVGVKAAKGLKRGVPEIRTDNMARAARRGVRDVVKGSQVTAEEIAAGKLVPSLTRGQGGAVDAG